MPGLAHVGDGDELRTRIKGLYQDYDRYMKGREHEKKMISYTSQLAVVATKEAAVLVRTEIRNVNNTWTEHETLLDSGALGSSYASQLWVIENPDEY